MSTNGTEQPNNGQAQNDDNNQQQSAGHPAWQQILDVLPESLHGVVTPTLRDWDQGVQQKIESMRSQYDPYKDFVENDVDPIMLQNALGLAQRIQADPSATIADIIEAFNLDTYVPKTALEQQQAAAQQNLNPDPFADPTAEPDFMNHPAFKAMADKVAELTGTISQRQQQEDEAKQAQEWESYLDQLKDQHGEFDRDYVTTMVTAGMDGVAAVKQYHKTVNQAAARLNQQNGQQSNQQQAAPPVVMGAEGTAGSGLPNNPVSMGALSANQTTDLVQQMLAKMQSEDNT